MILRSLFTLAVLCSAAQAMAATFNCTTSEAGPDETLTLSGDVLTLSSSDTLNGMSFSGTKDDNYSIPNYVRFKNSNGSQDVVIEEQMLSGKTGYMRFEGHDDGEYGNLHYTCHNSPIKEII